MSEIKIDKRNYRKHSDRNKSLINKSLSECGAGRSILIDNENSIVAGNGIFEQAQKLDIPIRVIETDGTELIAVKRTDLATDDEKRKQLAVMDNSTSDASEFDFDLLKEDFSANELVDFGIDGLEIDVSESQDYLEENDLPPSEDTPVITKLGDLWVLGNHRLLCGDSTKTEDIEKLMNGEKADMILTDMPYGKGLDTDYRTGPAPFRKNGKIYYGVNYTQNKEDDFSPEMITTLFRIFDYVEEMFLWGADYFAEHLPNRNAGAWMVWDKCADLTSSAEVIKHMEQLYSSHFELCWSKKRHKREIVRFRWRGLFGTEQEFDHKRYHPTQKPIALSRWFLEKYSKESQSIVDLYGGSGCTLLGCEQLNRKCYMMEIDPKYCDVIIRRWQKLTGQQAIHEVSGKSFDELSNDK